MTETNETTQTTTTRLTIQFGRRTYPDRLAAVWGARLIWPNDLVYDRQDMAGRTQEAKEELKAWLNGAGLPVGAGALTKALKILGPQGAPVKPRNVRSRIERPVYAVIGAKKLWPEGSGSEEEAVIYQDAKGKIVGSPQGSYGYIYVCGWLFDHLEAEAGAKAASEAQS